MQIRSTWLLMALLAISAAAVAAQQDEEEFGSAGSEDIYLQANSGPASDEEDSAYEEYSGSSYEEQQSEEQQEEDGEQGLERGENIEAVGLDEHNCEFSCPRYYRPVCASRNEELITYATPCEYYNQVRCANVARRQGRTASTFALLYDDACKENRR